MSGVDRTAAARTGDAGNVVQSFGDKWHQNPRLAFDSTLDPSSDVHRWIVQRNGFADADALRHYLSDKSRVLDAGCGNGRVTALLRELSDPVRTAIVGVDLTAADVAQENLRHYRNVAIHAGDLLGDLSHLGSFDFIYCQEVLHHTPDPRRGFRNLAGRLATGGEIAIYVYRRKAPVREYVDDFVREQVSRLEYERAMEACEGITHLGRALAETGAKVRVPNIETLGIPEGEYDVQRLVYHFFMKCFWNPDMSWQENVAINYDWYHPQVATRHTMDEVLGWFRDNGLAVVHQFEDFYGITVRGRR